MTNELPQTDSPFLPSFLAFFREHYAELAESISQEIFAQQLGPYHGLTLEQVRTRVAGGIQPYFQALVENSAAPLNRQMDNVLQPSLIQQAPIEALLQIIAIYRTAMLELSLQAFAAGVEGSSEGTRQLMALFDRAVQAIGRAYQAQLYLFQTLAEYAPDGIGVAGLDGIISYANPTMRAQLGYGDEIIGTSVATLIAAEDQPKLQELRDTLRGGKSWQGKLRYQRKDQSQFIGEISSYMLRDTTSNPLANVAIVRDITVQLEAEAERQQLQQQLIEGQQAALAELSTPLIPISDDTMVMPLIGVIDSGRAGQLVERLLEGVVENHADTAIIDITGVPIVDTQVAQTLLRAAQAASLVGARVVLTGIRPEVAQTLVGLGVDMEGIITRSTLQNGIAYALGRI